MGMVILLVAIFVILCFGFAAILSKFDIVSDYLDDITEGDNSNAHASEHYSSRHYPHDDKKGDKR